MRNRYKRLSPEHWQSFYEEEEYPQCTEYAEIPPVFGKPGFYFDRKEKKLWFEVNGRAFDCSKNLRDFKWQLKQMNHRPLTEKEFLAIRTLRCYGSCPNELSELYFRDFHWREIRDIRRGASKYTYKFRHYF